MREDKQKYFVKNVENLVRSRGVLQMSKYLISKYTSPTYIIYFKTIIYYHIQRKRVIMANDKGRIQAHEVELASHEIK